MINQKQVYDALAHVADPEIPVLSVLELGMITDVNVSDEKILVKMIPTYAACPATTFIKKEIEQQLKKELPNENIFVEIDNSIHWNSNRISEVGKEKLKNFKIAPPNFLEGEVEKELLIGVECPHCGSTDTILRTPFGSTLCRAIQFCKSCSQTFEQFKPV